MIEFPASAIMCNVEDVQQQLDYSCGVAVLQTVVGYWGIEPPTAAAAAAAMGTDPRDGTGPRAIVAAASRLGLQAKFIADMTDEQLITTLAKHIPVILSIRAYGTGHYVVAVGIDRENVYVSDPMMSGTLGYLPRADLPARWWDEEDGRRIERGAIVCWRARGLPPAVAELVPV